jgi:hypothetical protein
MSRVKEGAARRDDSGRNADVVGIGDDHAWLGEDCLGTERFWIQPRKQLEQRDWRAANAAAMVDGEQ